MNGLKGDTGDSNEKIIGIVPNVSRNKGLLGFRQEAYTLVLTDLRIIFALVTKEVQTEAVKNIHDQNKASGKGFWSSWGDKISAGMSWFNRYLDMDPEAILAENSANFSLARNEVISLKVQHSTMDPSDPKTPLPFLRIKTRDRKFKLRFSRHYGGEQTKMLKEWISSS